MIRNVVLLTLHETATDADRSAIIEALHTLPQRIPEIQQYSAGTDLGLAEGNVDVVAVGDFADQAGYETYRDHDAHHEVIATYIKPVLAARSAIQYEL